MSFHGHELPNKGKTDVWLTPLTIIEKVGPFDLDPCGEPHWPTAKTIYPVNGLDQPWAGRVWLNPPYSEVGDWMAKLQQHGNGIALVFVRSDVGWFQDALHACDAALFMRGRIVFHHKSGERAKGNAGAPSCMLAFGKEAAKKLMKSDIPGVRWHKLSDPIETGSE